VRLVHALRHEELHGTTLGFVAAPTKELFRGGVEVDDSIVNAADNDRIGQPIEDGEGLHKHPYLVASTSDAASPHQR
jgi:hypothetical protein